jgi:hypothetical protein
LLDLLEYVVSFSSGAPILLLCLARPDLFDNRPSWAAPRPNTTIVVLAPLSEHETEALIGELTRDLSRDAEARIVEAAEGNPLFVEQMLALQAEEPDGDVVVPPTIQALLAARIDRLRPEERAVVERASVEGRLFHRGAVSELLPPTARAGIGTQLMSLVRKEFLRPDRSLFPGDDGFRFSHMLIRDAAYESMPKQLRAELHERYAQWLEQRGSADEYDEILAYHLEQSYEARAALGQADSHAQTVAAKAGLLLAQAGRRALSRGDVRAAAGQLRRATALLAIDPAPEPRSCPITDWHCSRPATWRERNGCSTRRSSRLGKRATSGASCAPRSSGRGCPSFAGPKGGTTKRVASQSAASPFSASSVTRGISRERGPCSAGSRVRPAEETNGSLRCAVRASTPTRSVTVAARWRSGSDSAAR